MGDNVTLDVTTLTGNSTPDPIPCGQPGAGEFASVFVSNYTQATYTCYEKYALKAGNLTRYCQPDGSWSGTVPYCARDKVISETSIALITASLALIVLILLPIDYVLSKRRVRRQKLWERRATKRKRKERVAAFNMIAIKHAGNLSRPPLVLLQAADSSMRPVSGYRDRGENSQDGGHTPNTENNNGFGGNTKHFTTEMKTLKEDVEPNPGESDCFEPSVFEGGAPSSTGNPRTLPPLESKPSKRKKKKKRRRITPESSMDVDDSGGFDNAGFHNSNSYLDKSGLEPTTSNKPYQRLQNKQNSDSSEQTHCVDIHQEDEYDTDQNMNPSFTIEDEETGNGAQVMLNRNESIALQVGYNNLGNLATDV